jgi:hypothetical protein
MELLASMHIDVRKVGSQIRSRTEDGEIVQNAFARSESDRSAASRECACQVVQCLSCARGTHFTGSLGSCFHARSNAAPSQVGRPRAKKSARSNS